MFEAILSFLLSFFLLLSFSVLLLQFIVLLSLIRLWRIIGLPDKSMKHVSPIPLLSEADIVSITYSRVVWRHPKFTRIDCLSVMTLVNSLAGITDFPKEDFIIGSSLMDGPMVATCFSPR